MTRMTTKSNISTISVNDTNNISANDASHNTSSESKKSLLQIGSSFLNRIQSSTSFMGPNIFNIIVQLLNDSESVQGTFKKTATGQDVLDFVCKECNIVEKDFFGLRYNNDGRFRYWLDLQSPLSKTFKSNNVALSFRFRWYPSDLTSVKEEVTRYNLFVQLQRDLSHGRLQCHQNESARLAALILQADQGDFDEERHLPGYVSEFNLLLRQSQRTEEKIAEYHKEFRGISSAEAIDTFLNECIALTTYGVHLYSVTMGKNHTDVVVGASPNRILVFVTNQSVYNIPWEYVKSIDYSGKHLKITFKPTYFSEFLVKYPDLAPEAALTKVVGSTLFVDDLKHEKNKLKFTCQSSTFAKNFWRDLLGTQVFYQEDAAKNVKPRFSKPRIPLITRGSTFRCPTTRVMHEISNDTSPPREQQHEFHRYTLPRQKARLDFDSSVLKSAPLTVPSIKIETPSVHLNEGEPDIDLKVAEPKSSPITSYESESSPITSYEPLSEPSTEPKIECPPVETLTEPKVEFPVEIETREQIHQSYNEIHIDSTIEPTKPLQNGTIPSERPTEETPSIELRNGSLANGKLTNGTTPVEKPKMKVKSTLGRQIFIGVLDLLVLLLLISVIVIVTFEVVDQKESPWFEPHINNFRVHYYNRWRSMAINRFNHLFY